jgi:hypothetical protein
MTTTADVQASTIKALHDTAHRAKRVMPVVGTPEHPTDWDMWHATLDELLNDLVGR